MWQDQGSNPGPLALESEVLQTALHSLTARYIGKYLVLMGSILFSVFVSCFH